MVNEATYPPQYPVRTTNVATIVGIIFMVIIGLGILFLIFGLPFVIRAEKNQ